MKKSINIINKKAKFEYEFIQTEIYADFCKKIMDTIPIENRINFEESYNSNHKNL